MQSFHILTDVVHPSLYVSVFMLLSLNTGLVTIENLTCGIAAPTGLAAFNVGGITMHRLFQLPIEHEGKTAGYWALSKESQKVMRNRLHHIKLIIIDEVSMVSSLTLAYIHLRLEELFGNESWLGGKNMVGHKSFINILMV